MQEQQLQLPFRRPPEGLPENGRESASRLENFAIPGGETRYYPAGKAGVKGDFEDEENPAMPASAAITLQPNRREEAGLMRSLRSDLEFFRHDTCGELRRSRTSRSIDLFVEASIR